MNSPMTLIQFPDSLLEIDGFLFIRADRDEHSGKGKGGGIGVSTTSGAGSTQPKTSCETPMLNCSV